MGLSFVTYRKDVFEVIDERATLIRVRPRGEDDDSHAFWMKAVTAKPFIEKPPHKLYHGMELPDYVITWCLTHLVRITVAVSEKCEDRFAFNLKDANGQEYNRLMPGVTLDMSLSSSSLGMDCLFDEDVPEAFNDDIYNAQARWGCRKNSDRTTMQPRVVSCNALAWELLRNGKHLG